jgi:hypothetical protein
LLAHFHPHLVFVTEEYVDVGVGRGGSADRVGQAAQVGYVPGAESSEGGVPGGAFAGAVSGGFGADGLVCVVVVVRLAVARC